MTKMTITTEYFEVLSVNDSEAYGLNFLSAMHRKVTGEQSLLG